MAFFIRHYAIASSPIRLAPGLVLIKGALALAEQVNLTNRILEIGKDPSHGFKDGERRLNSTDYRGRMFNRVKWFGSNLKSCKIALTCSKSVNLIPVTSI